MLSCLKLHCNTPYEGICYEPVLWKACCDALEVKIDLFFEFNLNVWVLLVLGFSLESVFGQKYYIALWLQVGDSGKLHWPALMWKILWKGHMFARISEVIFELP